jgi:hypothetical protein
MTLQRFACCIALIALVLLGAAPISKISSMLAKPNVLCGRFDQLKQLVGLKKPVTSSGRFCVVSGKGILWLSLEPFPNTLRITRDEIIELRGGKVSTRIDSTREPKVQMINGLLFSLLAGDIGQLENLFQVEATINNSSWTARLTARDKTLAGVIAKIALEGDVFVKKIVINEASGDRTEVVFTAFETGDGAISSDEAALF